MIVIEIAFGRAELYEPDNDGSCEGISDMI